MTVEVMFASFYLSEYATELLMSDIAGILSAFSYEERDVDFIRGLATMKFERVYHKENKN